MKITEFRKILFDSYGIILNTENFKGFKSKSEHVKNTNDGKIELVFDVLNHSPLAYEFHFCFILWIKEISEIKKLFFSFIKQEHPVLWATPYWEGEFVDDLDDKEWRFRSGFYREVKTQGDLGKQVMESANLLSTKALPFINLIANYEGFRYYFLDNHKELTKRFFDMSFFISVLLCAMLDGHSKFAAIANFYTSYLNAERKNGRDYVAHFEMLSKVKEFYSPWFKTKL